MIDQVRCGICKNYINEYLTIDEITKLEIWGGGKTFN